MENGKNRELYIPIIQKTSSMKNPGKKEYTTVPEFYFLFLEIMHAGLIPLIEYLNNIPRIAQKLESEFEKIKNIPSERIF